jgi:hypothetical protein
VSKRPIILAAALVFLVTLIAFAHVARCRTTNWDDEEYLRAAQLPLSKILTTFVVPMYHPLTMLSLKAEILLAPGNDALLHETNAVIHAATAALLVVLLWQLTGSLIGATAGALLWSVHPLRVESVAWLVERKDVLYAFFFVAALIAYMRRMRVATMLLYIASLLSKPAAVTLPVVMLAIDFVERRPLDRRAIVEKVPYFVLAIIFGIVGIAANRALPQTMPGFKLSLATNAFLSFRAIAMYLERTIVPLNLSALYPYPHSFGASEWIAPFIVFAIIAVAIASLRRTRAIAFAAIFFFATIGVTLPLIAKAWAMAADRYTYVPSIAFSYLAALAIQRWRAALVISAIAIVALALATNARIAVWRDSVTLWSSVIDYDDSIELAYNSRGVALAQAGLDALARADFDRAVALSPCYSGALENRAVLSHREHRDADADRDLRRAAACGPNAR